MVLEQLASLPKVLSVLVPICAASGALYYLQRGSYPLGRTLNNEWFDASASYMESMPRQGSDQPVRLNPWSKKINMHSVTY